MITSPREAERNLRSPDYGGCLFSICGHIPSGPQSFQSRLLPTFDRSSHCNRSERILFGRLSPCAHLGMGDVAIELLLDRFPHDVPNELGEVFEIVKRDGFVI